MFRKPLAEAFEDPATAQLLRGVSDITDPEQLAIVLVPGLPDEAPTVAPAVRNAAVDGLIVYSLPGDDPLVAATRHRRVPTVIVDSPAIDDLPDPTSSTSSGSTTAAPRRPRCATCSTSATAGSRS